MNSTEVVKHSSVENLTNLANYAKNQGDYAKRQGDDAEVNYQQVQDAINEALNHSDVDVISYDIGVKPSTTGTDGTIGAYFKASGIFQKLEEQGGAWTEIGKGLLTEDSLFYNVQYFGAKGDGSTNDTQAFQAAHDAIGSEGGVIYVPPSASSYIIDGTDAGGLTISKSNVYLYLEAGAKIEQNSATKGGGSAECLVGFDGSSSPIEYVGIKGQGIIDGGYTTTISSQTGFAVTGTGDIDHISFRDFTIQNHTGQMIWCQAGSNSNRGVDFEADNVKGYNCAEGILWKFYNFAKVKDCTLDGIHIQDGIEPIASSYVTIKDNHIKDCGQSAVDLYIRYGNCEHYIVEGNIIDGYGQNVAGAPGIFLDNNPGDGFFASNVSFHDNVVLNGSYDPNTNAAGAGIELSNEPGYKLISAKDNLIGYCHFGIGCSIQATIEGNTIEESGAAGIKMKSGSDYSRIIDNDLINGATEGTSWSSSGIFVDGGENLLIYANRAIDDRATKLMRGIYLTSSAVDCRIFDNDLTETENALLDQGTGTKRRNNEGTFERLKGVFTVSAGSTEAVFDPAGNFPADVDQSELSITPLDDYNAAGVNSFWGFLRSGDVRVEVDTAPSSDIRFAWQVNYDMNTD